MPVLPIVEDIPGRRLVLATGRHRIAWDRDRGLSLTRQRWLPRGTRTVRIATTDLDEISMSLPPRAGADLPLTLAIHHRRGQTPVEEVQAFAVAGLDRPEEALDLAFRIAQIIGFGGYLVRGSTAERLTINLVRHGPAESSPYRAPGAGPRDVHALAATSEARDTHALPSPADYASGADEFIEPVIDVPPLLADEWIAGLHLRWQPGQLLVMDAARTAGFCRLLGGAITAVWTAIWSVAVLWFCALLALAVPMCVWDDCYGSAAGTGHSGQDPIIYAPVIALGLVAVGFAAVCGFGLLTVAFELGLALRSGLRHRGRRRRARFDLERGLLTLQVGRRRREIPLAEIEGVVHRCRDLSIYKWSELELQLAGDDELLLVTERAEHGYQRDVFRLAIGLARALDVPWRLDQPTFGANEDPLKPFRS